MYKIPTTLLLFQEDGGNQGWALLARNVTNLEFQFHAWPICARARYPIIPDRIALTRVVGFAGAAEEPLGGEQSTEDVQLKTHSWKCWKQTVKEHSFFFLLRGGGSQPVPDPVNTCRGLIAEPESVYDLYFRVSAWKRVRTRTLGEPVEWPEQHLVRIRSEPYRGDADFPGWLLLKSSESVAMFGHCTMGRNGLNNRPKSQALRFLEKF